MMVMPPRSMSERTSSTGAPSTCSASQGLPVASSMMAELSARAGLRTRESTIRSMRSSPSEPSGSFTLTRLRRTKRHAFGAIAGGQHLLTERLQHGADLVVLLGLDLLDPAQDGLRVFPVLDRLLGLLDLLLMSVAQVRSAVHDVARNEPGLLGMRQFPARILQGFEHELGDLQVVRGIGPALGVHEPGRVHLQGRQEVPADESSS